MLAQLQFQILRCYLIRYVKPSASERRRQIIKNIEITGTGTYFSDSSGLQPDFLLRLWGMTGMLYSR